MHYQKWALSKFSAAASHSAESNQVPMHHFMFHPRAAKNSFKIGFASFAEAKKEGKASRQAEDRPKQPMAVIHFYN